MNIEISAEERRRIMEALAEPFPREAIKKREGSRGQFFDYVEGHSVINRLNAVCTYGWDWTPVGGLEWKDDIAVAAGILTIHGVGSRYGRGVQKYRSGSGEDLLKGADTDALKVAASKFGVAIQLYGPDYEAYLQKEAMAAAVAADGREGGDLNKRTITQERRQVAQAAQRPARKPNQEGIGEMATLLALTRLLHGFGLDVCAAGKEAPNWSKAKTLAYFNLIVDYILDLGKEPPARASTYRAAITHAPAWWAEQAQSGHPDTVPAIVESVLEVFGGEVVNVKEGGAA